MGIIKWVGTRNWNIYYFSPNMRHGETTSKQTSTKVTKKHYESLLKNKIIPTSSKWTEI